MDDLTSPADRQGLASSCPAPPPGTAAWVDESYDEEVYVLAAVVVTLKAAGEAEAAMRELVHPRRRDARFHFAKEEDGDRLAGAAAVGSLRLPLVVAVRTSRDGERGKPERARGQCWQPLLWQRHGLVDNLVLDARQHQLNRADAAVISGVGRSAAGR